MRVLIAAILTIPILVQAQEEDKKVSISDVYLMTGSNYMTAPLENVSVFQQMVPESILLNQDLTGFQEGPFYKGTMPGSNSSSSLMIGLNVSKNPNAQLRLGFNHRVGIYAHTNYYKNESTPYDTLTSSQTGEQFFVDSTHTTSLYANGISEYLGVEGSMIFRTSNEERWSFYAGFGLSLGFCFNNRITVIQNEYNFVSGYYGSSNYADNTKTEYLKSDGYLSTTLFFPLGIDFTTGKKRDFWKRVHLFAELRPSLTVASIPNYETTINPAMNGNLGLRIHW
jgi:hypothetical protein